MEKKSCILFCRCKAEVISAESLDRIALGLKNLATDVFELHDLCALALHEKDFLNQLGNNYHQKIVIACYPRAIKNMFRQNAIEMGDFEVLNFKVLQPETILSKLETDFQVEKGEARYQVQITELDVPAW